MVKVAMQVVDACTMKTFDVHSRHDKGNSI